jgi:peptidyl-prolyl cis-trans isomerase C
MFRSTIIATATMIIAAQVPATKTLINTTIAKSANIRQNHKVTASPKNSSSAILVKIGNQVIRQSDFDLFLKSFLNDQQRSQFQNNNEANEQVLNYFLRLRIMAAKAQKDGLHNKPEYTSKISIARMQILAQSLIERDLPTIESKITVTDEEIKDYFHTNKEMFKTPETFSARHILVSNKTLDNELRLLTNEEMQVKITKIQDEIKRGKSFADVASEYSDDPGSKDRGGLYENIAFGKFATEFEQAVRSQEIDKIGDPIKTQYGYHLIEVKKITPSINKTFEESKEIIKETMIAERKKSEMEKYFNKLKKAINYKQVDHTIKN